MTDDDRTLRDRVAALLAEAQEARDTENAGTRESVTDSAGGWRGEIEELLVPVWLWNLLMALLNVGLLGLGVVALGGGPGATVVGLLLIFLGGAGLLDSAYNRVQEVRASMEGD